MSLHRLIRSRGQCRNQYLHDGFPLVGTPKSEKLKQNSGALPLVQEEHGLVLSVSGVLYNHKKREREKDLRSS